MRSSRGQVAKVSRRNVPRRHLLQLNGVVSFCSPRARDGFFNNIKFRFRFRRRFLIDLHLVRAEGSREGWNNKLVLGSTIVSRFRAWLRRALRALRLSRNVSWPRMGLRFSLGAPNYHREFGHQGTKWQRTKRGWTTRYPTLAEMIPVTSNLKPVAAWRSR
jgi:hypothetical protein